MEKYFKDFDSWNNKVKLLDSVDFNDFFYSREIWWCALGVNIGSEQDGKNESFERSVLILKKINKDLLWIVPLTSKVIDNEYRTNVKITGIQSQVSLSQLRSISSKRLLRKIGTIKSVTFYEILIKLAFILLGVLKDETPP